MAEVPKNRLDECYLPFSPRPLDPCLLLIASSPFANGPMESLRLGRRGRQCPRATLPRLSGKAANQRYDRRRGLGNGYRWRLFPHRIASTAPWNGTECRLVTRRKTSAAV